MKSDLLLIPPKLKVGFNTRADTYTGRLGYVIYYDTSGKLCKEKSWESWRDKKIDSVEYDNVPTEGFVINKNGGGRGGHSWNDRQAFVRVYDPRNFEFEIAVDNLVFILCQGGCHPGKGLEGKFVYAWRGGRLVLMPCHSKEYADSTEYTRVKNKSLTLKELVPGGIYLTRALEQHIYLGRLTPVMPVAAGYHRSGRWSKLKGPPHVFYNPKIDEMSWDADGEVRGHYHYAPDLKDYAEAVQTVPVSNLGELAEEWARGEEGSPIVSAEVVDVGVPVERPHGYDYRVGRWLQHDTAYWVQDGPHQLNSYEFNYPLRGDDLDDITGRAWCVLSRQWFVRDGLLQQRDGVRPDLRGQPAKDHVTKHGTKRLQVTLASGEKRWASLNAWRGDKAIFTRDLPPRLGAYNGK